MVPAPLTNDHNPVPVTGMFPFSVALVPHTLNDPPALETEGDATLVMVTCDELGAHGGFEMVH